MQKLLGHMTAGERKFDVWYAYALMSMIRSKGRGGWGIGRVGWGMGRGIWGVGWV